MSNKLKKFKIIFIFLFVVIGTIVLLLLSKNLYSYNLYKAVKNTVNINTASIEANYIRKVSNDSMTVNYKFNYNKEYNYNKETVIACDGLASIESESASLGIYAPVKLFKNDSLSELYLEIPDEYQNVIKIPLNNTKAYFDLSKILNDNIKVSDLEDILIKYVKDYKSKNIKFMKNKEVNRGNIAGEFSFELNQDDYDYISNLLDSKTKKILKNNLDKLKGLFVQNDIYTVKIEVYNGYISSIDLSSDNQEIYILIKNPNNPNTINNPTKEDYLDVYENIENKNISWSNFLGYNSNETIILKDYVSDTFDSLTIYMSSAMLYADEGNITKAYTCVDNLADILLDMTNQNVADDDKEEFQKYYNLFEKMYEYSRDYVELTEDYSKEKEKEMNNLMEEITEAKNNLIK